MASYYEKDTKIAKGFTVRGDWDENTTYDVNDIVAFEGQLFVALERNTGIDSGLDRNPRPISDDDTADPLRRIWY